MYQESGFRDDARPARQGGFLFLPGKRPSNAYGYAQAKTDTWAAYKKDEGGRFAQRDSFADATDFVGWYLAETQERTGVSRTDAKNQYLAYHEGAGGYLKGSYKSKKWLVGTANTVASNAAAYDKQLSQCKGELRGGFMDALWPF
jgi:hypothetical protein